MGKLFTDLDSERAAFIAAQPMFFVATACAEGRVNCSPKGMDTLRVLGPREVAYLDLTGSGNETAAHIQADGRLTLMWCAFGGAPRILRTYGRGRVVFRDQAEWADLAPRFPDLAGARQIIVQAVESVQTSCGFGVPRMELVGERDQLVRWAQTKGAEGVSAYRREKNVRSLDGLPTNVRP
jgi:hypothetical protein